MILWRIYLYFQKKNQMIRLFQEHQTWYRNGEYVLDDTFRYIHLKDQFHAKLARQMFGKKIKNRKVHFIKMILRRFCYRNPIIIDHEDGTGENFKGTVYLPSNNNHTTKDAKIFDLHNNKVISILSSVEVFQKKIDCYVRFKPWFPTPDIVWIQEENMILMERFIPFKANRMWTTQDYINVMDDIWKRYLKYMKECKRTGDYIFKTIENINHNLVLHIDRELLQWEFPFVQMHGDLTTDNILLQSDHSDLFYYIDWEFSDEYVVFYDIYLMIYTQFMYNDNELYLAKYAAGEYDDKFTELLHIFDIEFHTKDRMDYLHLFFLQVWVKRLHKVNVKKKTRIYDKYMNIVNKYKSSKRGGNDDR